MTAYGHPASRGDAPRRRRVANGRARRLLGGEVVVRFFDARLQEAVLGGVTRSLLASDAELVVLTAPAGYGKTTAVALWDDADARPFAWVRLDHLDNDPAHLLLHLVTAVDQVASVDAATFQYLRGAGRARQDPLPTISHRRAMSATPSVPLMARSV